MILLAVIITFFVIAPTTFAVCEYYNRRIIRAMKSQPLIRRKPTWKNAPKEEFRIPAIETVPTVRRSATQSAKGMHNTQYIDA